MLCGLMRKRRPVECADFSNRGIREVPSDLYDHRRSLQRLYLATNLLNAVPKGLHRLESLTELDLSENNIIFLPPTIGQLTKLKVLNISKNNLPNIPEAIQNCEELISVNVTGNPIGRLCNGIVFLSQLRHLYANDCELGTLPSHVGRLSKLETLELRENHLMALPETISQLKQLSKLDLGCNEFEILPPAIGGLESLEELWVDLNLLVSIPPEFGHLKKLAFLELSDNRLMDLPDSFGSLVSLSDLYLGNNLLIELPDSFGQLQRLNVCHLFNNRLIELPDTIEGLRNLTDLNLCHNHINYVPPTVGSLQSLSSLSFDENQLEILPKEIGYCTSLSVLTLRNNRLKELPSTITRLSNLSILNVVGNRLSRLPAGIASMPKIAAIWIAENQSRPLLEFQVRTDAITGDSYLTCVVFPQQGPEVPFNEHQEGVSSSSSFTQPENESQTALQAQSSVNFDPHLQNGDKKTKGISRDLTPFPKELHTKIKQWRTARETLEPNDTTAAAPTNVRRRNTPKKMTRPRSLLKALTNPVQDGSGMLEASNSRSSTLSPDLLMHLPTSDLTPPTAAHAKRDSFRDTDTESELDQKSPRVIESSLAPDIVPNPNSNNNNSNGIVQLPSQQQQQQQQQSRLLSDSATSGIASNPVTPTYNTRMSHEAATGSARRNKQNYASSESGFYQESAEWYRSPTPSPSHVTPVQQQQIQRASTAQTSDGEDYDHLINESHGTAPISPSISSINSVPSPVPAAAAPLPKRSFTPVLSPRTVPPQPLPAAQELHNPVDLTALSPILRTSFASKLHQNRPITTGASPYHTPRHTPHHTPQHARHSSEPDSVFSFPTSPSRHAPLTPSASDGGKRPHATPLNKSQSVSHNRLGSNERDYAVEHTLQSCQKPQLVRSDNHFQPHPTTPRSHHPQYMSTEGFLNVRRPRTFTDESRSSYTTSTSGRDTPDTPPRLGYKSVGSVSSSGNDSGVELLRRAPPPAAYALPRSISNSTSVSIDTSSTYEVTLKKSPTLGLGITGGKDGENAIKPGDKGFYVFRLVNNLPAARCGKINIGDKILAVNGVETSNLSNDQLVKLLTTQDMYVTILFSREPSITLL